MESGEDYMRGRGLVPFLGILACVSRKNRLDGWYGESQYSQSFWACLWYFFFAEKVIFAMLNYEDLRCIVHRSNLQRTEKAYFSSLLVYKTYLPPADITRIKLSDSVSK